MHTFNRNLLILLMLPLLMSCGSENIALINKVKRFEPQWMNLSEQATFIEQKLSITRRRYPKDLEAIEPEMRNAGGSQQANAFGLRSQYRNIMVEREKLEQRFVKELEGLESEVEEFNEWVNGLMKGKFNAGKAEKKLEEFQAVHKQLKQEINEIEKELIKNIQEHNSVMKQLGQQLRIYNNFDIAIR